MAYIQQRTNARGKSSYRARVRIQGHPDLSETFSTKREAKTWATRMEVEIKQGRYFPKDDSKEKTFGQMIDRYIEKELPKKPKSFTHQSMQLNWWNKHLKDYFLCHITPGMLSEIKEKLLEEMTYRKVLRSPSTANRYLAALSGVFTIATNEWGWIKNNPLSKVSRFKEGKARERFLTKDEIEKLLCVCKYSKSPHLYKVTLFAVINRSKKGRDHESKVERS
jgi:integrase